MRTGRAIVAAGEDLLEKFGTKSLGEVTANAIEQGAKEGVEKVVKSAGTVAKEGRRLIDDAASATTPVGRRRHQATFPNPEAPSPRNAPTKLFGREFSGHALDRMQEREFTPSIVQNAIEHGVPTPQPERGTIIYWDAVNKFNVSVDAANGRVVTVF